MESAQTQAFLAEMAQNSSKKYRNTEHHPVVIGLLSSQKVEMLNSTDYQYVGPVDEIDERDSDDPQSVTDYVQDMYNHFLCKEFEQFSSPSYITKQSEINEAMRSTLIDWLVEVHLRYKLRSETLYLAVNIIDRYLEKKEVKQTKFQLVGLTALLIASKYEEIYHVGVGNLGTICKQTYSREEIVSFEIEILETLGYRVTIESAHTFLVRFLKAAHADKKIFQMSSYILEGSLYSYKLLRYSPSQLAAGTVLIARRYVGRNPWSPTLLKFSSYCEEELSPISKAIISEKKLVESNLFAVKKKYSTPKYGEVARIEI